MVLIRHPLDIHGCIAPQPFASLALQPTSLGKVEGRETQQARLHLSQSAPSVAVDSGMSRSQSVESIFMETDQHNVSQDQSSYMHESLSPNPLYPSSSGFSFSRVHENGSRTPTRDQMRADERAGRASRHDAQASVRSFYMEAESHAPVG